MLEDFEVHEKEILVLTSDSNCSASKMIDSWVSAQYFLAYFDMQTNDLIAGEGRINWIVPDEIRDDFGIEYPHFFKIETIYHLKVRALKDKTVPEGYLPSYYNRFLLVEILGENINHKELNEILIEYRTPVVYEDPVFGKCTLNKTYSTFSGTMNWNGARVRFFLDVSEDKASYSKAFETLHQLYNNQEKLDMDFKNYAAEELTNLANDWSEEDDDVIEKTDFAERITLCALNVDLENYFTFYYDDDEIFLGHSIEIFGNLTDGFQYAKIVG